MASLFIGSAIGPFVSSQILKHTGSLVNVFYVAFIVDIINVLYTMFILPESNQLINQPASQQQGNDTNKQTVGLCSHINIFSALKILFKDRPLHLTRYALPCIALADFLLALVKRPPTMLYAMLKFKWTAYEGSLYYTCTSLMKLMMMIGVLPLLSKLFKKKCPKAQAPTAADQEKLANSSTLFDIWMVRIGIGMDAVCLALAGLASNVVLFTTAGMLQSVSMLAQPSIRGLLTTCVEPNRVGELLGAVAILDSLASKSFFNRDKSAFC